MPTPQTRSDEEWMRVALHLAQRGNGRVSPNPAVGCIIVKNDIVVGRGWTQPGGRPHAETVALQQAGNDASGATAYVTLEPCAHYGQTPPCAEALVSAGIKRVVIALSDPDIRVNGKGVEHLKNSDIDVEEGVLRLKALKQHAGFVLRVEQERPLITLKLATSSDFKIAKANGDSKWITGPKARRYGHMLRAQNDAILVGVNTVLADDPLLTCRIQGLEELSPIRIVLDSQLKTPLSSQLVKTAHEIPTLIITENHNVDAYKEAGVKVVSVCSNRDIMAVCKAIADQGINSILVEGGAKVATAFAREGFVDLCAHFRAPGEIGSDGIDALNDIALTTFLNKKDYTLDKRRSLGPDVLELYRKTE